MLEMSRITPLQWEFMASDHSTETAMSPQNWSIKKIINK